MTTRHGFSPCLSRRLAVAALIASSGSSFAAATDRQPPPNIVFMLADDQGWNGLSVAMAPDVPGSRGEIFQTPNLARRAAQPHERRV